MRHSSVKCYSVKNLMVFLSGRDTTLCPEKTKCASASQMFFWRETLQNFLLVSIK